MTAVMATSHTQLQDIHRDLIRKEPEITHIVEKVISSLGGTMAGRDHAVKSVSSMENKIYRLYGDTDLSADAYCLSDLIRYTCLVREEDIPEVLEEFLNKMEKADFLILKVEDYFQHPKQGTHYKGLHVDLLAPNGLRVEIQVHTLQSYQAKMKAHWYYQIVRMKDCSKRKRKKAMRQQRLVFDSV